MISMAFTLFGNFSITQLYIQTLSADFPTFSPFPYSPMECPLKVIESLFYFTLKALFVLKVFKSLS